MLKLMKTAAVTAAILSASAASANAFDIYGFIKSNTSQFGGPVVLTMEKAGGDFRLKSATTQIPISYEAGIKGVQSYLLRVDVRVDHITKGKGPTIGLRRQLDETGKDKVWGNASLPMTRAHLTPIEQLGQDLCASHEGPGEKMFDMIIPLEMIVTYYSTNMFAPDNGQQSFTREGDIPAKIVCEAPVNRVPPPPVAHLLQLKLYTIPARPICGKPVVVMAEFFVNYPGPVNFQYWRDNGDHQNATVTAAGAVRAGPNLFLQRWSKSYTFSTTENRRYRIVPQGSALTTNWVDINVHCIGGYAGTPGNANPDGQWPGQPKAPQPKGPFGEKTAPTPTHGTFRPVIVPATPKKPAATKTAPVPGERSSRYIGGVIQRIQ